MKWIKIKHIFKAENHSDWMFSHGANPVFKELEDGTCRVFFTCRDKMSKSYIAYLDLDFENDFQIVNISKEPVLTPGELGLFDDSGVVMSCFQEIEGEEYLYYLGWNLKVTVPWLNTIGLAKLNKEQHKFEKVSKAPIMDRSDEDPFSISYPCVLFDEGVYKMWYGSNLSWGEEQSAMNHVFKYAESNDGVNWKRTNQIVVGLEHKGEYALSKPWVVKDQEKYKMWYSYRASERSDQYRIGYAESDDGIKWIRKDDQVGIDVSPDDSWDSDMISYPCVFDYKGERYMLYTGNGYGKEGFGIAILKT
jgi:predicted GH43/DUF377 family glycosyl hydrolase